MTKFWFRFPTLWRFTERLRGRVCPNLNGGHHGHAGRCIGCGRPTP